MGISRALGQSPSRRKPDSETRKKEGVKEVYQPSGRVLLRPGPDSKDES